MATCEKCGKVYSAEYGKRNRYFAVVSSSVDTEMQVRFAINRLIFLCPKCYQETVGFLKLEETYNGEC